MANPITVDLAGSTGKIRAKRLTITKMLTPRDNTEAQHVADQYGWRIADDDMTYYQYVIEDCWSTNTFTVPRVQSAEELHFQLYGTMRIYVSKSDWPRLQIAGLALGVPIPQPKTRVDMSSFWYNVALATDSARMHLLLNMLIPAYLELFAPQMMFPADTPEHNRNEHTLAERLAVLRLHVSVLWPDEHKQLIAPAPRVYHPPDGFRAVRCIQEGGSEIKIVQWHVVPSDELIRGLDRDIAWKGSKGGPYTLTVMPKTRAKAGEQTPKNDIIVAHDMLLDGLVLTTGAVHMEPPENVLR